MKETKQGAEELDKNNIIHILKELHKTKTDWHPLNLSTMYQVSLSNDIFLVDKVVGNFEFLSWNVLVVQTKVRTL